MGERQNDGGPAGRRRAHPEGAPPGSGGAGSVTGGRRVVDTAELEALLAAALVRPGVDAGAEQRAVAAFLAAREPGAHGARTRRRDDWRARRSRLGRHSLKATLSALVAGLALSGVAVAGIGATGSSTDGPAEEGGGTHAPSSPGATGPSPGTAGPSVGGPADPGTGTGRPDRPGTARDADAPCRAHGQLRGRGEALDSTAWKRLVEAAGGAANVDAYCAGRRTGTGTGARPGTTGAPQEGGGTAGRSANGSSGGASDRAARGAGNGSGASGSSASGNDASDKGASGDGTRKSGNPGAGRP
ncbi:hypothetical protein ABTY20_33320 [Streptomyces sp. NPDC126497]|uniref:hypothetical protein n=1 Tax=Streptomyces sp. NPDC126497 TaxID=3155313 RepID=UPI00332E11C3